MAVTRQEQPGRDTEREQTRSQQRMRHLRLTPDDKERHIHSKAGYRWKSIANMYFKVNNS